MTDFKRWIIFATICGVIEARNFDNYFANFDCYNTKDCTIEDVESSIALQQIYINLGSYDFSYNHKSYECQHYGDSYCKKQRQAFTFYTKFTFVNSQFSKFPSGDYSKLNHIKSLTATNVGLVELNRDDLKSFKSLEFLDLSNNNITTLSRLFLLHVESLKSLELQGNQIAKLDPAAFDESSSSLIFVDLSNNKLEEISENLLDTMAKSNDSELMLQSNQIQRITPATASSDSPKTIQTLNLNDNRLQSFVYECSSIKFLKLNDNQLDELQISNCSVDSLELNNNNLSSVLVVSDLSRLKISNSKNLLELNVTVDNLKLLEMKGLPARLLSYEQLKKATTLEYFDAADTFLGPLKIDTFSEMSSLQVLNLSNTGLAHIDYGMFTHQKAVYSFDISHNNLQAIDLNMLASMKSVKMIGIGGNNLTWLEHVEGIEKIFPSLEIIAIDENQWNCSYLAKLIEVLSQKNIAVERPRNPVKNSPNVIGHGCRSPLESQIDLVSADKTAEKLAIKVNEIIEQVNKKSAEDGNHKRDLEVIETEIFSIRKEILEIQTKLQKSQIASVANVQSANNSADTGEIRAMVEQLNNLTLEKQKIAYDQLILRINEMKVDNKAMAIEIDRLSTELKARNAVAEKMTVPNFPQFQHVAQSSAKSESDTKTVDILLAILITLLAFACVIFGYSKLKKTLHKQQNMMNVRARSTNTINTTIELPFSEESR